jgi:hypothetical protein
MTEMELRLRVVELACTTDKPHESIQFIDTYLRTGSVNPLLRKEV